MPRHCQNEKEKDTMFKWERKLVETIEKKLPVLAFFIITLLAFYMRRAGYWHTSFDLQNHFYKELPTYLHTPFYTFLIRLLPVISITPVKQVKILVCLFDFVVALEAVQLLKGTQTSKDKNVLLACYTLLLASPLTIESGLLWVHLDSVCMSAFLGTLVLYRRKHSILAGILLGVGTAILTQYAVLFLLPAFYAREKVQAAPSADISNASKKCPPSKTFIFPVVGIVTAIFLNAVSIGVLGLNWQKGLFMLINWLVISPENGIVFSGLISWLKAMPAYFGYMIGTLSLIAAFRQPKYRIPAAVIHLIFLLYIGHILQYGW